MSYSSFVPRIAAFALLSLALAAGTAHVAAQPHEVSQSKAIGQLTIGDSAPVPIFALSSNVQNTGNGGGGGAGQAALSDITVVKQADAQSTALFRAIVRGLRLPSVRIDLYENGKTTIAASFELADVLVTEMTSSGDQGEAVAFAFAQVTFTAAGQSFCWDTNTNTTC